MSSPKRQQRCRAMLRGTGETTSRVTQSRNDNKECIGELVDYIKVPFSFPLHLSCSHFIFPALFCHFDFEIHDISQQAEPAARVRHAVVTGGAVIRDGWRRPQVKQRMGVSDPPYPHLSLMYCAVYTGKLIIFGFASPRPALYVRFYVVFFKIFVYLWFVEI